MKGYDEFNTLLCNGVLASEHGDYNKALEFYLAASQKGFLEYPNFVMFQKIALTYARLGQFENAYKYLKYDDISILWAVGIVRCQSVDGADDSVLLQDGHLMGSDEARYLANHVLCGEAIEDNVDFSQWNAENLVSVAKAILEHKKLRSEIYQMSAKAERPPAAKKP
jgi:hypothetical protein